MWPNIGPIPTYGLLYFLGIIVHFCVSRGVARRLGLKRRVWIVVSVWYYVAMTLGAKALYDIRHSDLDLRALFTPEHYMKVGLWGGLLVHLVLAVPLALLLSRRRRSALDLIALSIPIPLALAKIGCFLSGCCYGRPSSLPWAIAFPVGSLASPAGVRLHPTQLYELAVMAVTLLVLKSLRHDRWQGTRLLWFLAIYGLGRAATDMFRGDTERYLYLGPLTLTQVVCLTASAVSILSLILWTRFHRNREAG